MCRYLRLSHCSMLWATGLILVAGCHREAVVVRLLDFPEASTRDSAILPSSNLHEELNPRLLRRFAPIHPAPQGQDSDLVRLGRVLYFEPLLSRTGKISCNSCHPLDRYGATNSRVS